MASPFAVLQVTLTIIDSAGASAMCAVGVTYLPPNTPRKVTINIPAQIVEETEGTVTIDIKPRGGSWVNGYSHAEQVDLIAGDTIKWRVRVNGVLGAVQTDEVPIDQFRPTFDTAHAFAQMHVTGPTDEAILLQGISGEMVNGDTVWVPSGEEMLYRAYQQIDATEIAGNHFSNRGRHSTSH